MALWNMKIIAVVLVTAAFLCLSSSAEEKGPRRQAKFLAAVSTRTRLSTLTSTTFYTCITALGASTACARRKKRVLDKFLLDEDQEDSAIQLDGSQATSRSGAKDTLASGKLFVGITSYATLTYTSFTMNPSTTIVVSYSCYPSGGVAVPPMCG